ncbi:hypothetical protein NCS57_01263600 [Fusarium keratoplasticum]|uniref:Uncharacterized protein n=1 Tax=Fusarium keratoplasticum TaxID=1328300 RepID=A0ACC0QJQ7_9HYPO|nr:hypothetical protein NCS57_01263600 [Fusarium keratoplasticum]KAI8655155.1 hypothetical protein NCS57_01263600 [Fusarium keratoplasticum]
MEEHRIWQIKLPPEECPNPDSLGSLEAIYRELCRIDDIDRRLTKSRLEGYDDSWWEYFDGNSNGDYATEEQIDAACRDVTWRVDRDREALRGKAMHLSHDTLRRLGILDLPMEILVRIFGFLQHQDIEVRDNSIIYWPSKVQSVSNASEPLLTIYNARQVCRLFNTLASPLLCPFLNLKIEQESLDRAEILLENPYIASGVMGIQVSLEYRPIELAESFRRFAIVRMEHLGRMNRAVDWPIGVTDEEEQESRPDHLRIGNYQEIYDAWDYFLGFMGEPAYLPLDEEEDGRIFEPKGTYQPDRVALEFWRIFCNGHKEYVRLQKSQHDLIQSRTFVKTLSSLASRLNRPLALRLHSSFDSDGLWNRHDAYKILTDNAELAKFMPTANTWSEMMHTMRSPVILHQVKILSELPIAMHEAGVVLRYLTVGCFPELNSYSTLCPGEDESLDSPEWGDLSAACQHLEVFQVEWGGRPARGNFLDLGDEVYNERYVNSVLSSQQLQHVNVTISPFGLTDSTGHTTIRVPHMPAVLANINWPRIKHVSINTLSLNYEELEHFCKALGLNVEYIGLISINLESGSWANILDILRDKMASSRKSERCRVWLADLRGGELGQRGSSFVNRTPFPRGQELEDPGLIDWFRDYIKGEMDENPAVKSRFFWSSGTPKA